jgi:hypothetical protein
MPDRGGVWIVDGKKVVASFIQHVQSQRVSEKQPADPETLLDVAEVHK